MTLEEAIYGRRSIRKFNDKEVPELLIRSLIDAAIHAPSACNLQGWKFLVVRKGDRKVFHNEILFHAPAIIFVAYKNDANSTTGTLHKDYVQSAAAAIENLLLMAYNKGLGACWICDIPESTVLQAHFHLRMLFLTGSLPQLSCKISSLSCFFLRKTIKIFKNKK